MNNLIIKELYRASLFCKMSFYTPAEMAKMLLIQKNDFKDIEKIINYDRYFDDNNLKCYVFRHNNTIFISLNSLLMYKTDKQQDKWKNKTYIHSGLLKQYKIIEDKLLLHINQLANSSTKKLYITGYYMGGGLATIAAAILGEKYKNIYLVSCFTFASPKVGNKHFKEYFRDNVTCNYRIIVNDKIDLITNLNNYNAFNYYKHHCSLYSHFVTNNYYHVSNAFLLEDNNILEFPKPKLKRTEKLLMKCSTCNSCCNNIMDELVDIDIYINRFNSIIFKYKTNLLQKQKTMIATSMVAASPEAANTYFETFAISTSDVSDGSSNSSSVNKSPKKSDTDAANRTEKWDLALLHDRIDKLLEVVDIKFRTL
jgi:hypothetical protein